MNRPASYTANSLLVNALERSSGLRASGPALITHGTTLPGRGGVRMPVTGVLSGPEWQAARLWGFDRGAVRREGAAAAARVLRRDGGAEGERSSAREGFGE